MKRSRSKHLSPNIYWQEFKRISKNKKIKKKKKEELKNVYQMSDRVYEHFN